MGSNRLGTEPPLESELTFQRRWSVRLRVGAGWYLALGVLALLVAVAAVAALTVSLVAAGVSTPKSADIGRLSLLLWAVIGSVAFAASWRAWRIVTRRGHWLATSSAIPALVEADGNLLIEKYSGTCSECGSNLRFYSRPIRWHQERDEAGSHTVIDERSPAAECSRDARHWWRITR